MSDYENCFVTANVLPGKTNALVKKLMAQMGINDPNEAVRRVNAGEWIVRKKEKSKLLELVNTVDLPACEEFIAVEEFRANRSDINLWMSDRFRENFFGKIEKNIEVATLSIHKLLQESRNSGIIAELGGHEETTLYHLFALLMRQADNREGLLLANGYANIFYIRDSKGVLRVVYAYRGGSGWVLACFVGPSTSSDWPTSILVISRKAA